MSCDAWALFRTQSASRTVLVLAVPSILLMMFSARITIGGAGFPPGLPRWKQQLTATLAPQLLGSLDPLGLRPNEQVWGVGHGWAAFSLGSTGTRQGGGRTLRGGKKRGERESQNSREQPSSTSRSTMGKDQLRCLGFVSYSVRFCGRYSYS